MADRLADFADFIEEARQSWHIPGVAVAVIKGEEVLHCGGYGVRNLETGEPVTTETLFPIASMTKPFTAMGAALLVDEGLLDWDQPIREVLPQFRMHDEYTTQHATLRDLLSHRTGLPRHDAVWYGTGIDDEAVIARLRYLKPNATFREKWQYNNLMFHVVGHLTAQQAGVADWSTLMQQRIFQPLGLSRTIAYSAGTETPDDNVALPYRVRRGSDQAEAFKPFTPPYPTPAGSIHSTLADLMTWLSVHVNEGRAGDVQLVTAQNLAQMHTPHMVMPPSGLNAKLFNNTLFAYGLGWFIQPYREYTLIHHGGNINGFSVIGAFVPQAQLGVIVLTNIEGKPLRDVLLYEAVDRALDLPEAAWNDQYHAIWQAVESAEGKDQAVSADERHPDAPPSHPLASYAGTYRADGYADFVVAHEEGNLRGFFFGDWWPLAHYHYNVFELDVDHFEVKFKVIFGVEPSGAISSVSVPVDTSVENILFRRAPLDLDDEVLAALQGTYDFPIEGMAVVVRQKGGSLYAALTGQPETELAPTTQTTEGVTFAMKGEEHVSLEFRRGTEGYDLLRVKQFGALFECPRIE